MPPRFVIHGRIGRTPRRLAAELGATNCRPANSRSRIFDWNQDLFLTYPSSQRVNNAPSHYLRTSRFYYASKSAQRGLLHAQGIPIVPTYLGNGCWLGATEHSVLAGPYVHRPDKHQGGRGFTVFNNLHEAPVGGYVSKLIQKTKEFRVLYYRGQRVCTYLKSNPQGVPANQPWNHSNGTSFQTINYAHNNPLLQTDLYTQLETAPITQNAHLLAYDVVWDGSPWVCEVNFCPGITIQNTFERIKQIEQGEG